MDLGAGVRSVTLGALALSSFLAGGTATAQAQAASAKKPNILVIFGDDIGYCNVSAYNLGMMHYKTPNIDRVAQRRRTVYRLLRAAELHGGPGGVHYWTKSVPHRAVESRAAGCRSWLADAGSYDRRFAEEPRLHDLPEWQEPSWRPERIPADGTRFR